MSRNRTRTTKWPFTMGTRLKAKYSKFSFTSQTEGGEEGFRNSQLSQILQEPIRMPHEAEGTIDERSVPSRQNERLSQSLKPIGQDDEAPMDEMELDELRYSNHSISTDRTSTRESIEHPHPAAMLSEPTRPHPLFCQLELSDSEDEEVEDYPLTNTPQATHKVPDGANTPSTVSLSPRSSSGSSVYSETFLSTIPCKFEPTKPTHRRAHTDGSSTSSVFSRSARSSHERFKSVLDRPFRFWKAVDSVLESTQPDWSPYQRGRLIHHLIHFLELKIGFDQYIPAGLLLPSPVVDEAWMALVLETKLYKQVTRHIQDFHGKPRKSIHFSMLAMNKGNQQERLKRTQELFQLYFREQMPVTIEDESSPPVSTSSPAQLALPCANRPSFMHLSSPGESLRGLALLNIYEPTLPSLPVRRRPRMGTI